MHRRRTDPSQYYIPKEDLNRAVEESKEQGQMTEEMGQYVIMIHSRVAHCFPRFKGYSAEVKEEIQAAAIYKFIKYRVWEKLNPSKGSVFAYITTCAFRNMLTALGNYYRDFNRKRELVREALEGMKQYFSSVNYIPSGWEEACKQLQREYGLTEEESTLQDGEEET